MYKPERLAALYGVKLERPPDKSQPLEPWNDVVKGEDGLACMPCCSAGSSRV